MANIAKDPQVALGRAIRLLREELGISQQELGLELRYGQGWISHIENGLTNPAVRDRLARALTWPLSRLVVLAESIETEGPQAPRPARARPEAVIPIENLHQVI